MPAHNHIDAFLHDIARDLVAYANVYILKIRRPQPQLPGKLRIKGVPRIKPKGKDTDKPTLESQDPIVSYEILHPATIWSVTDTHGNVIRYEQWPWGETQRPSDEKRIRKWDADQIIHIAIDKEDGFAYGTPFLDATMDDIRQLRSLEDNISRLTYRFTVPFTQVKVGLPLPGLQAGEQKVDDWQKIINRAPSDATLVTPEDVEFVVVGVEGEAIKLDPYIEHFKGRVFSGLGVSPVSMGEGDTSNRSTADAMSVEMHDSIKHYQNILSRSISNEIYRELLLENGIDLYADLDRNWAQMLFNEIETEAQIKKEAHTLLKVQGNVITISEGRKEMGLQPFTEAEWNDSYLVKVLLAQIIAKVSGLTDIDEHGELMLQKHKMEMQASKDASKHSDLDLQVKKKDMELTDAQILKTKADAKNAADQGPGEGPSVTTTHHHSVTTGGGKRNVTKKLTVKQPVGSPGTPKAGPSKGIGNIIKPANQFGKRLGPKRSTEAISAKAVELLTAQGRFQEELETLYADLHAATLEQGQIYLLAQDPEAEPALAEFLFHLVEGRINRLCRSYLLPSFNLGVSQLEADAKLNVYPALWNNERTALLKYNEDTINRLIKDLARPSLKAIKTYKKWETMNEKINGIFDSVKYRLELIAECEIPQSFWYGYCSNAYINKIELDLIREEEACEDCQELPDKFSNSYSPRKRLTLSPTIHPRCSCTLAPSGKKAQQEEEQLEESQ